MAKKPKRGFGKLWEVRHYASTVLISLVLFMSPPDVVTIGVGPFSFEYHM